MEQSLSKRSRFSAWVARRFSPRLIPVYLFVAFILFAIIHNIVGVLIYSLEHADPKAYFVMWFTDLEYVDAGIGFARRMFYDSLSVIPLALYLPFARTLKLRNSLLMGLVCAALSTVPMTIYGFMEEVPCYFASYHWMNYVGLILTLLCYVYVAIVLVYGWVEARRPHRMFY